MIIFFFFIKSVVTVASRVDNIQSTEKENRRKPVKTNSFVHT